MNRYNDPAFQMPVPRQPTRIDKMATSLNNTIDIVLALHALGIAKGLWTHEEVAKMTDIVSQTRPKLGATFTIDEGIKAIVTAFRIEVEK